MKKILSIAIILLIIINAIYSTYSFETGNVEVK